MRFWVSFFCVLLVACLGFSVPFACAVSSEEAAAAVTEADAALRGAFRACLDAEAAGANVSGLVLRLNEAGEALAEAEVALGNGNSSEAFSEAGQCVGIAEGVKGEADALGVSALDEAQTMSWTYLAFSVAGIAAFVVVLGVVWRWFKRRLC